MPAKLWPEAVRTAAQLHTFVPAELDFPSPYELFHRKQPNIKGLRAYGCPAYVRLEPHERSSTGPVAVRGRLVAHVHGGYLVWKDVGGMHRASRDVWFDKVVGRGGGQESKGSNSLFRRTEQHYIDFMQPGIEE